MPRTGGGNPYAKSVTIESPALSTHGQGYRRALQTARTEDAFRRVSLSRLFFAPCGREEEAQRASDRGGRKRRIHNSQTILSKIANKGVAE